MNAAIEPKPNPVQRKVVVGGLVSGIVTIACWCVAEFAGKPVPAEVAVALSGVLTFVLQYFVPNQEIQR